MGELTCKTKQTNINFFPNIALITKDVVKPNSFKIKEPNKTLLFWNVENILKESNENNRLKQNYSVTQESWSMT